MDKTSNRSDLAGFHPFWRGHLFLFDPTKAVSYTSKQGRQFLLIFILMELILRPISLVVSKRLNVIHHAWYSIAYMTFLICLFFFLTRALAKVQIAQLGLYSWLHWTKTEKLYFLQIIPTSVIIFSVINYARLQILCSRSNVVEIICLTLFPQLVWGFYQEALYRGILQTELVRRWGTYIGILTGNFIFTFGPLHSYHFWAAQKNPAHLWIFFPIFCIGLFFSILFQRSGNLWIIGIMHGVGDLFIEGLGKI